MGGSITTLAVAPGNMINDPTQPIMTIADLGTVWVTAMAAEKDVAAVCKNQDADVSLAAYPDRVLRGKVLFVSDVIEPDSRRNKMRIAFANRDYALKPNMFATVTLRAPSAPQVVLPRIGAVDEQRPNQRVRRHRAVDLRAPHRRSGARGGAGGRHPLGRQCRRTSGRRRAESCSMIDQFVGFCLHRRVAVIVLAVLLAGLRRLCLGDAVGRGLPGTRRRRGAGDDADSRTCRRGGRAADHGAARARDQRHAGAAPDALLEHLRAVADHGPVSRRLSRTIGRGSA